MSILVGPHISRTLPPIAELLPEHLQHLSGRDAQQRVKDFDKRRKDLERELGEVGTNLPIREADFDEATGKLKRLEAEERAAIQREATGYTSTARSVERIGQELPAAREAVNAKARAVRVLAERAQELRSELDRGIGERELISRALEAARINEEMEQLAKTALSLHDHLCRTLISLAGKDEEGQRLGLPKINPMFMNGSGFRVDNALRSGAYQSFDQRATQVRLDEGS